MVLEISYFEEKKSSKIEFQKPIFDPRAHKWAPIFVFMRYFCSVIRNKEFDVSQGVFTLHFWKIEFFFTLFCTIASFYKISHRSKTRGHRKKRMWFSALELKTAYAQMFFFLHFEVKSQFYGENKKKIWKKSWNFDNFSASRCDISGTVGPCLLYTSDAADE